MNSRATLPHVVTYSVKQTHHFLELCVGVVTFTLYALTEAVTKAQMSLL